MNTSRARVISSIDAVIHETVSMACNRSIEGFRIEYLTMLTPRSLEKGASQGPPALVNLPPQWGPEGRQQSASVIDADGRHLLRQLGGQRSCRPLCADVFYSIVSCMYYR